MAMCKEAATEIGRKYRGETSFYFRPKGCHLHTDRYDDGISTVYWNNHKMGDRDKTVQGLCRCKYNSILHQGKLNVLPIESFLSSLKSINELLITFYSTLFRRRRANTSFNTKRMSN